ncbi:c-type cytochrome [Pontibacterium granulatum]|uniref:c-type cytochrome n=1 Tax=Pontibacterium granulatum TaxID=2036029 RepID=UPI002499D634|nr:c-type cytochrome [Pontibacterium granulatum]MDI3325820.1 c-type cytochrome [Pontibacterium granulatum]
MKKTLLYSFTLTALAAIAWVSLPLSANIDKTQINAEAGNVARGAYLARASGCIACHTNIEAGGPALAGGAPLKTPFGTFYAPNLTTDKQHGIGNWTLEDFATALRSGISPEGSPYYPAFPYDFYTKLSDQDIADLWAAFQTVPSVNTASTPHELSFPFNVREGLNLWQSLFFKAGRYKPSEGEEEQFNRGKYLVESAAHCAACHSPRNLFGALDEDNSFAGSQSMLEGEGSIPAITPEALKAAGWSQSDLSYALKSGIKPDGDVFGGSMGEVVRDGTAFLQKQDLDAVAHYLLNRK